MSSLIRVQFVNNLKIILRVCKIYAADKTEGCGHIGFDADPVSIHDLVCLASFPHSIF